MRVLVVPPAAQRDESAVQMLTAWIAEEGLHCTLNIGMWHNDGQPEGERWGVLLADVIRHVANAMHEEHGADPAQTISTVVASLLNEIEEPTSNADGGFHPGVT